MNNIIDFAFPYILQVIFLFLFFSLLSSCMAFYFNCSSFDLSFSQFIREYTSKVDELVKDKIDAQKEVKAKEQEEKELVAKQVLLSFCIIDGLCHTVVVSKKCIICLQD